MELSVIIPTLNEAACIEHTLQTVLEQDPSVEINVADGGSTDETRQRAERYAAVITGPQGRAVQMNRGAAVAAGETLLFLHADTHLPPDGLQALRHCLQDPEAEAGAFRLHFDHATALLRFYSFCTRFPFPRFCFGDRCLFVRRSVFRAIGGYPEIPIFEDLEIVYRLHHRGGFRFLPQYAATAARRFRRNGPLRQQMQNSYLWLHYLAGTDPAKLAHRYRYDTPHRGI